MGRSAVPFADLGLAVRAERREIATAIDRVLESGRYIGGEEVEGFEREWAEFTDADECVAVASGTDAIKVALRVLGKPGGRVLTVANSAMATVTAITEAGMKPLFCDVVPTGRDAGLMDLDDAESMCQRYNPSVLMPVHLYGRMVDMARVSEIGKLHDIIVVEDACQAHGSADVHGIRPGERSDAACWSHYPTKNLGALGDAGAITLRRRRHHNSRNQSVLAAKRCRWFANYGLVDRDRLYASGWNSRMDPIQAAILRTRIPRIHEFNAHRLTLAELYATKLGKLGLSVVWGGNAHIVALRHPRRHAMQEHLKERGITTLIHYRTPAHRQKVFARASQRPLPNTDRWCAEIISLPLSNYTTRDQVVQVCDAIADFMRRHAE